MRRAAPALEAELLDPRVTLAAKTVVVEAIATLGQPTSADALRALQRELAATVPNDELEKETLHELSIGVDRALGALRRRD